MGTACNKGLQYALIHANNVVEMSRQWRNTLQAYITGSILMIFFKFPVEQLAKHHWAITAQLWPKIIQACITGLA